MGHKFQRIPWKIFKNAERWDSTEQDCAVQYEDQSVEVDVWPGGWGFW